MTDFFTRCCKRISLLGLLVVLGWAVLAWADGISVKRAELVHVESAYQLNADFAIDFTAEVEKALNKGVPLDFLIEFQLVSPSRYWFDDEIVTRTRRIGLHYHALSRQYLIKDGRHQKSFATLEEAIEELARVRDWPVFGQADIVKGEEYAAILRFRLDSARLPKALQVETLGSETWNLVSERHRWIPVL